MKLKNIEFSFTGKVSPDQLRHAVNPIEPIAYQMDTKLINAIKEYTDKKRSGPGLFLMEAVDEYIRDLDSVLLSAIECKARRGDYGGRPSVVRVLADTADMLQQAADFLKKKGYKRIGRGGIMVACALLHADKLKLLPSFEEETTTLIKDGKVLSKK